MMTKKDFIALADAIIAHNAAGTGELPFDPDHVTTLAAFYRSRNPQFNRERWIGYIRGECGPNGGAVKEGA